MNNVLYVNKPKGISSFDVCYKLRKVLNTKKIGHTGTLDPNATGVMIILYDNATKASQFLVSDKKEYEARVVLGIETDTLDIGGKIINESKYIVPNKSDIECVLNSFVGKSKQTVPITSAKSVNGKRLYKYQLENKEVELPIIDINVYSIDLLEIYEDGFSFRCEVSSGTYIRSLAQDILKKLNLIGTLKELCRTKIDYISINNCDNLDDILNNKYTKHDLFEILSNKYYVYETEKIDDIKNGKRIKINCDKDRVLITSNKEVLAIYSKDGDEYLCVRGLW